jgi:hypothetical protein
MNTDKATDQFVLARDVSLSSVSGISVSICVHPWLILYFFSAKGRMRTFRKATGPWSVWSMNGPVEDSFFV